MLLGTIKNDYVKLARCLLTSVRCIPCTVSQILWRMLAAAQSIGHIRTHTCMALLLLSRPFSCSHTQTHTSTQTTWVSALPDPQQSMWGRYPHNRWLTTLWSLRCSIPIIRGAGAQQFSGASQTFDCERIADILPGPTSFSLNCILILHLVTS